MQRFRACCAAVSLTILAGCTTWDLQELRQADPKGNEFQRELAANYLMFAEQEAAAYDWADSQHFAQKGLVAAYGHDVAPENPDHWDIDEKFLKELRAARSALGAALTQKAKAANPAMAARALFSFDCWVEQQEEAWQAEDIKSCRDSFFESLDALNQGRAAAALPKPEDIEPAAPIAPSSKAAEKEPVIPHAKPAEAEAPGVKPMLDEPQAGVATSSYVVFFGVGKTKVDASGLKIIEQAVTEIKKLEKYEIILNGHTDASGNADTNLELALKRAEAVKKELVKRGIAEEQINVFSFGESDQKTQTKDGRAEKSNRRVEIFVSS